MNIYLLLMGVTSSLSAIAQDSIPAVIKGRLNADINNETSGLAASSVNKGSLYIHNDSGDTSRFFLIGKDGTLKAIYTFKANPLMKNGVTDCEDIAVSRGPKGKRYVYIGDIGDNSAKRKYITVYRIKEPKLKLPDKVLAGQVNADPLYLKYPDGPRDAETLMVDPVEKLFYIISKREDSVSVYTAPLLFKPNDTATLTKRCTLFFEGANNGKWISGGSISGDGSQVLVKSYLNVFYWKRKNKEPLWQLLMTPPLKMPYKVEQQGEAIGFATGGNGYYTISEGMHPEVYYYEIK